MICTCKKSSVHGEGVAEMAKEMCVTRPCRPTSLIAVGGRWFFFSCTWRFWHHWDEGVSFPLQFAPLLFNNEGLRHLTVMSHWLVALQWLWSRQSGVWNYKRKKKKKMDYCDSWKETTEMNDETVYKHSLPSFFTAILLKQVESAEPSEERPAWCLHSLPCTWCILVLHIENMQLFPLYNHCWIKNKNQTYRNLSVEGFILEVLTCSNYKKKKGSLCS